MEPSLTAPRPCRICKRPVPLHRGPRAEICDTAACRARATQTGCPICGAALSVHQKVQGVCEDAACRRAHYARRDASRREEEEAAAREASREVHEATAREAGLSPEELHLATFHGNNRDLVPQDPERVARLRAHVAEISQAAEGVYLVADVALSSNTRVAEVSVAACATCWGGCCVAGGDTAYLKSETVARYLTATGRTAEQAAEDYASRVPEQSYADSCIFHGPQGCGLSRVMRSDTCNDHMCFALVRLRREVARGQRGPTLLVALADNQVARSRLLPDP